jgi:hypothetical protein
VIDINEEKQHLLDLLKSGTQIIMDTNMYIYYYESQMGIVPQKQCQDKNTKDAIKIIFEYLIKYKIPICLPKIIYNEVKKVMAKKKADSFKKGKELYQYNEDIIYYGLTLHKDEDEEFEKKFRNLANTIFYEESNDFLIYIYSKENNKEIIITENTRDFDECEKRYNQKTNTNHTKQTKVIILGIAQCIEIINSQEKIKNV